MIEEVNETNFKEVLIGKRVLVDFNATWCGPCRMLKPILEELNEENKIKIISVDVDKCENLASEYGISSIPCLIIFNDLSEEKRNIGLMSLSDLEEFIGE